jgi:hypothetical protein
VTAALVRTGVVTVCCGGHRPAADCTCCLECPVAHSNDPALLALLASGVRAHNASLRMALRRAFHAVTVAAIDDHLADLAAAMRSATRPVWPAEFPHLEGRLL